MPAGDRSKLQLGMLHHTPKSPRLQQKYPPQLRPAPVTRSFF
jgi:hypothetical protein